MDFDQDEAANNLPAEATTPLSRVHENPHDIEEEKVARKRAKLEDKAGPIKNQQLAISKSSNGNTVELSRTLKKTATNARDWHRDRQDKVEYATYYRGTAFKLELLKGVKKTILKQVASMASGKGESGPDPRSFFVNTQGHAFHNILENEQVQAIDFQKEKTHNDLIIDTRSFGSKKITQVTVKDEVMYLLAGMKNPMYTYQLFGAAYMIKRECSVDAPHGYIQADETGLGKTFQVMATIVGNPPTAAEVADQQGTTLIVVPSSIVSQWRNEFDAHTVDLWNDTREFKASADKKARTSDLTRYRVVLTTYGELRRSLGNPPVALVKKWKSENIRPLFDHYMEWHQANRQQSGLLHQINWYRIILDEGHIIKNALTHTSRAALLLRGRYRGFVSGTPIMNRFSEFFPIFRFLEEPITSTLSFQEFSNTYYDINDEETMGRLSIILSDLMIRRKITDQLFGKPIVQLPPVEHSIFKVTLTPPDKILYLAFELKLRQLATTKLPRDDPRKPMQNRLAAITRLRQYVAHPDLVAPQIQELLTIQKKVSVPSYKAKFGCFGDELSAKITRWIEEKESGAYGADFDEFMDQSSQCWGCSIDSPTLFNNLFSFQKCKHVFCARCINYNPDLEEDEYESNDLYCPQCHKSYPYTDVTSLDEPSSAPATKGSPKFGYDYLLYRPKANKSQKCFEKWLNDLDSKRLKISPSSKCLSLWKYIDKFFDKKKGKAKNATGDKLIIFSQFRHFQVMVGWLLAKFAKRQYVYYTGEMSVIQRDAAVKAFHTEDVQIMVMGLKCGGLGLNLAIANHVIIMDIWWNSFLDQQAFGRSYRIGQQQETNLTKMAAEDTLDEQLILMLQQRKDNGIHKNPQEDAKDDIWAALEDVRHYESFAALMATFPDK